MNGTERMKRRRTTLRRMLVTRYLWMFLAVTASIAGASALTGDDVFSATVDAVALTDKILFQVETSDLSAVGSIPSMQIELSSQFGRQTQPLEGDLREGVFDGLFPNVLYRLSVQVESSFGWVEKASTELRTKQGPSAGFVVSFPPFDGGYGEALILPTIQTYILDPDGEYSAWRIRHQIFDYQADWTLPSALAGYETVALTDFQQIVETYPFFPFNQYLSVFLEGQNDAGEWVLFEHRIVSTPLVFEASVYVTTWLPDRFGFSAYLMDPLEVGATFSIELWKDGAKIDSITGLTPTEEHFESSMSLLWFKGLTKLTEYQIKLTVDYVDPHTGIRHQRVLEETTVKTPDRYRVQTEVRVVGNQVILDLELWDPSRVIGNMSYNLVNQPMQEYLSGPIVFEDQGGGKYTASVVIDFTQSGPKLLSLSAVLQIDSESSVTTSIYHDTVE